MNQERYIELIAQHLAGEISESDRKSLLKWVDADAENRALFEETQKLWAVTDSYETEFDTNIEAAWNKVENKIQPVEIKQDSSAKIIRLSNFKRILQIAAVFLIAGMVWMWASQETEPQLYSYQIGEGQKLETMLPDSSIVILNENSLLTYQEIDDKRMVTLEGEAWFDVQHLDHVPFEILSGDAKTRVLGTAFNVRAYPEEDKIEVSVERGKVAFSENENLENLATLPAGTEGTFYKKEKKIVKDKRENDNANAWRTLTLDFENVQLQKVFETLERYFDVEIEANPNILKCELFGKYTDPKIDEVLQVIEFALDAKLTKNGNKISFIGEGCPSNK